MKSPLKTKKNSQLENSDRIAEDLSTQLAEVSSDVKSYIYQSISEFEPFTTPETVIAVVALNPLNLVPEYEAAGVEIDLKKLKRMHRISISLQEDGGKIAEEALHEDIYHAIRLAKEKLLKKITEIQNEIITNQERKIQIDTAVGGGQIH